MILQKLKEADLKFSEIIHNANFGVLNHLIFFFAIVFNNGYTIILPLMYIYWRGEYSTKIMVQMGIIQLVGLAISLTLKKSIGRPRPIFKNDSPKTKALRKKESNNSMPSGDSLQAGVFASFCYLNFGEPLWFLIVPLVMYGRVHFVCHYIGDTIIGVLIAVCLVFSINNIVRQYLTQYM